MRLGEKKVAVLIAEGFEDLEYWVTVMRLREEGAEVVTVGMSLEPVKGKNALEGSADALAADVSASEFDGLVVPGGWAPDKLRRYPEVLDLVRGVHAGGGIIGVICHGGLVPISAGIVGGVRATGSLGIKDDLVNAGAEWADEAAFRDGNFVWGRVVPDIPDFCRELVEALA
ncbi:type 1 glutamine amidotransferase domain-containing protein [Rubrobacter indicoceani]|uniref:type 1 glutamine amidotransferase domain-containing protein n=1 Tax=Rubrobacter indicoceani TaxID=2051957 RepID=UPI000E5C3723|nr:type 1 glutamine amidotransferase domain-containing protein [Rubrobacter indicoceani]